MVQVTKDNNSTKFKQNLFRQVLFQSIDECIKMHTIAQSYKYNEQWELGHDAQLLHSIDKVKSHLLPRWKDDCDVINRCTYKSINLL